jgi:hypothetical protein
VSFATGSLVRARNREWVVLPESSDDLLMVRPLGGTDAEITGILTDLEPIESATFALPDPGDLGDYRSARMLRDALRLGFRSSAGPFRSIGRIGVTPRPYQLVPLLMALKLDPVRLLIADDVGIGKTIEAALIAKELLEQGDSKRMCVLCPPHLAEQWQQELAEKFHIDAELVLSSTAARLERGLLTASRCSTCTRTRWCRSTSSRATAAATTSSGPAPTSSSSTKPTPAPMPAKATAAPATNAISSSTHSPRTRTATSCW